MKRIVILPVARDDLRRERDYYERRHPGLGLRFIREARHAMERIAEAPEAMQVVSIISGDGRCVDFRMVGCIAWRLDALLLQRYFTQACIRINGLIENKVSRGGFSRDGENKMPRTVGAASLRRELAEGTASPRAIANNNRAH